MGTIVMPPPPSSTLGYPEARALIAGIIEGVGITDPVSVQIAQVYQFRPDGGEGLPDYPNVRITGYSSRYLRGPSSKRERIYAIGLRVAARPVADSDASIQEILDALKEAISQAFDGAVTLDQGGNYHVVEGPNWTSQEPQSDGGTAWDEGEILITIKDATAFAP